MLLVSAVHVVSGWAWHTAYRMRHHWRLKREGALTAAAFVAALGLVDAVRNSGATTGTIPATEIASVPAAPARTDETQTAAGETDEAAQADTPDEYALTGAVPIERPDTPLDLANIAPEDQLPPDPDQPVPTRDADRLGDMTGSISAGEDVDPQRFSDAAPAHKPKVRAKPTPKARQKAAAKAEQKPRKQAAASRKQAAAKSE